MFACPLVVAFALFDAPSVEDATIDDVAEAARWAADEEGQVWIRVHVHEDFISALARDESEVEALEAVVLEAFAAWENDRLRFEVDFVGQAIGFEDAEPGLGGMVDLFAVTAEHPVFASRPELFGRAIPLIESRSDRRLTNGDVAPGLAFVGVDLYLNLDTIDMVRTDITDVDALALKRLLKHEIGHGLGLGHPNDNNPFGVRTSFDTDDDPTTEIAVPFADPLAGLRPTTSIDNGVVMSNRPCGTGSNQVCGNLFNELQPDDLSGRNVLYPAEGATPRDTEELRVLPPQEGGGCAVGGGRVGSGWLLWIALIALRRRQAAKRP